MLTKNDLQAIKQVVDESIENRISPFEKRMGGFEKKMSGFEKSMSRFEKNTDKRLRDLHKLINVVLGVLDQKDRKIEARVERLEIHAGLPVMN